MKDNCQMGGCGATTRKCERCGFDRTEAARRMKLPLVTDEKTGLERKLIRKPENT